MIPSIDVGMPKIEAYELVKTLSQPPVMEQGGMTPWKCSIVRYTESAKPMRATMSAKMRML